MIETRCYCSCCNKVFHFGSDDPNYIDHVVNFSENSHYQSLCSVEDYVKAILIKNEALETYRSAKEISERLECFKTWPSERFRFETDVKDTVITTCEATLQQIQSIEDKAQKIVAELSDDEQYAVYKLLEYRF